MLNAEGQKIFADLDEMYGNVIIIEGPKNGCRTVHFPDGALNQRIISVARRVLRNKVQLTQLILVQRSENFKAKV